MRPKSRLERVGHVHVLTLDDDEKRNAIGHQLAAELVAHADALAEDPEARCLVVTGAGSAFCAGADLPQVFGEERPTADMRDALREYYDCFLRIRRLPFPTIAAVNGPAIGAGLNLALSCDIRIAGPRATFGATFTKIGLHPGGGCTWFLVQEVGRQKALKLLLEGAVLGADEAVTTGIAACAEDDSLAAALALAQGIAELEPSLARAVVRTSNLAVTAPFDAVLEFESWAQAESTHAPRFREWIAQFS